ncbi:MAG: alkene reductase [Vicinamibacterales bacterium]|nr:alkene reductase [Vicinamibacterales bacterium]
MPAPTLFTPTALGSLSLRNRIVMSPMTRSRCEEANAPNDLMAEYYGQRAGAGLIVTEGTSPAPNGTGYPRTPGLWSARQVDGWRKVTGAVHARGGSIFVQLMHTGRVGHPANLPSGGAVMAPSAVAAAGEIYTDALGMQAYPVPQAMTEAGIRSTIEEYAQAARNAMAAGFDGVELHGANGYLIEQFLNPEANRRTDAWGASVDGRIRFAIEVARATAGAIGAGRVGIRLSPYGVHPGMGSTAARDETFTALLAELAGTGIQYLHVQEPSAVGAPEVPASVKRALRASWPRTFIVAGGFDRSTAEAALAEDRGDLVAFGRAFLANPDLVSRLERGLALNEPDPSTFYTLGAKGYTDYPTAA